MNKTKAGVLALLTSAAACGSARAAALKDCLSAFRVGDSAAAIRCLEPLANAGDPEAELYLGMSYGVVNLPTHDAQKSAIWIRKAAEHGQRRAETMAGYIYRQGEGVPNDLSEAAKWFRTAAERGDQEAQYELGICTRKGGDYRETHRGRFAG